MESYPHHFQKRAEVPESELFERDLFCGSNAVAAGFNYDESITHGFGTVDLEKLP